ncbi:MAG: imidazole glycerol phosphate synthase subunit HisF [Saprospiraceae bacterium]|nr:imidazole glycerol phosphate synthase subunit HisF [Pyrinomonadaceae bacterium]
MFRPRIIPVLLLKDRVLVKSIQFKTHKYIGDPINAVRILNDLKADELVFLDIEASKNNRLISLDFVKDVGEEARMPFAVGGGIKSIDDIESIIKAGAEKVVISTHAARDPEFIKEASENFGSSTIVVCIDVKNKLLKGKRTWILNGSRSTGFTPLEFARLMEKNGAGELIIQSIYRDGMMEGYDIELIRSISTAVDIPVIALGGAGAKEDLVEAYKKGRANGLAAGSLFVYHGKKRGVLINYPDKNELALGELTFAD